MLTENPITGGHGQAALTLPVVGGGLVGARRVWCVGRNYEAHAREMGADPSREPPFFFAKPTDALCWRPRALPLPPQSDDVQHEVELAIVLSRGGADLTLPAAEAAIGWCAVAVDLTRRDRQAEAKAAGRPWEIAKAFDRAAPIGTLAPWPGSAAMASREIRFDVDGAARQQSTLGHQIWQPAEVVAQLSRWVSVEPGDVILCGTPAGVGRVSAGQQVTAAIAGLPPIAWQVLEAGAASALATEPEALLSYWFAHGADWFGGGPDFDEDLRRRFLPDVDAALAGELDHWATQARGRLALLLLLDQLPRNLFRGLARAFASHPKARQQARLALQRGDDRQLSAAARAFMYLPFEHAEMAEDTALSVALFARLHAETDPKDQGLTTSMLTYAERHHAVVARFGRYPHRNAALGRQTTAEEAAFLIETPTGF